METFIEQLLLRLEREGLKNQEAVCVFLGIDRGTWSRARRGRTRLGHRVIAASLRRYPDLAYYVPTVYQAGAARTAQTVAA